MRIVESCDCLLHLTRHAISSVVLIALLAISPLASMAEPPRISWAIAIHGGAGRLKMPIEPAKQARYEAALTTALRAGQTVLKKEGSALDAVEAAVIALEDEPLFNAGKGAVFTREGTHELDASIMDGATLRCGGVARLTNVKNPIMVARLVMEQTPHVLMCGREAEQLAATHGCTLVEQSYFYTNRRFNKLQEKLEELKLPKLDGPAYAIPDARSEQTEMSEAPEVGGTVGCVALDSQGNLAAATSTGGLTGKMVGRIGDSPIIGAGNYANQHVAASGTGKGEEYLRHLITARVAWLVESEDYALEEAVEHCLDKVLKPGDGGLIVVDRNGNICMQTTTGSLPCGSADSTGRFEVEVLVEKR